MLHCPTAYNQHDSDAKQNRKEADVCQKCGDRGYYEALTYCCKCHISAEHRYCLDKLPAKLHDEVTDWICHDCASMISKRSRLGIPSYVPPRKSNCLRSKKLLPVSRHWTRKRRKDQKPGSVYTTVEERQKHLRSAQATDCINRLKKKKIGPSFVTEAEVQSLDHGPLHQPCDAPCSKSHEKEHAHGENGQSELHDAGNINDNAEFGKSHEKEHAHGENGQSESHDAGNINDNAEFVKTKASKKPVGELSNTLEIGCFGSKPIDDNNCSENYEKHQVPTKQRKLEDGDKGNAQEEAEPAKVKVPESNAIHPSNSPAFEPSDFSEFSYLHAQPVIYPVWRGSFRVCNENFDSVGGLAAHLSSKACLKVCNQARLLPALLYQKMLPKSVVWPKSFQIRQPTDDNIALYFFPENERDEKVFDCLVLDMVSNELAMQTEVENAELLVFTSTELPLRHWRFRGKLYLWGVFRGKQDSSYPSYRVDGQPLIQNSSKKISISSNFANESGTNEEKYPKKVTTWDARSPLSPLSNSESHG